MSEVNTRDPEAIRLALLTWLHRRIPDAEEIHLRTPRKPEYGGSSETFFICPVIRGNGMNRRERWVLRIEASSYQVYMDSSVERQFRVLEILSETGAVPVPKPLWYESDPQVLGAPFFLMERVEGYAPPTMHHSHGVLAQSSAAAREAMWRSAIEALARIHRVTDPRLAFLRHPEHSATGPAQDLAYWHGYMCWSGAPLRFEQERAFRWLQDNSPPQRDTGLAWGDARPGNMIFQGNQVQAVIDWETASLASAETDLGWWLFFDWYVSEGSGIARLDGLYGPAETIKTWEQFSGRKAQAIEWHEVFGTLRFSLIYERARLLAVRINQPEAVPAAGADLIAQRLGSLIAG
jgi:aminoglycoside phosphotransferase (APT) family kinase protein